METADYISMFWGAQEMGVQALMLYITVTSGYLIVAYLVGAQLTKSQVLFVSTLFVVFALYSLWGVAQYWTSGYLTDIAFKAHEPKDYIELNRVGLNPAMVSLPMGILGILGSLKFMWDVKKIVVDFVQTKHYKQIKNEAECTASFVNGQRPFFHKTARTSCSYYYGRLITKYFQTS